jgi:hypothetical protein
MTDLYCGTCYHYKRNPMAPTNPLAYACLRYPPAPIFQINAVGTAAAGQAYPQIEEKTCACGDHETEGEYRARRWTAMHGPVDRQ